MEKHKPPKYRAKSFDCPHCGVYAHQKWFEPQYFNNPGFLPLKGLDIAACAHCNLYSVWYEVRLVYPTASVAPQPSPDMPEDVAQDFNEARVVLAYSPRSSAALLRLALQKLCIYLELPGKNLNDDIAALVRGGLSPMVQKALDIVRVIGNNAVHPGKLDLKDDQQTALILFDIINLIVEQMITFTRMIDTAYEKLPEEALKQIEKRDQVNPTRNGTTSNLAE